MEKKMKLKMVMMPNFITVETPPRPRQEGVQQSVSIPIADLTLDEAYEYARWMQESFIKHWENKTSENAK